LVRLEKEITNFKENLFRLSWYMRGGVSVDQLLHQFGPEDRSIMTSIVNENIEATKAAQMPLL
jgi:hypothetical protein